MYLYNNVKQLCEYKWSDILQVYSIGRTGRHTHHWTSGHKWEPQQFTVSVSSITSCGVLRNYLPGGRGGDLSRVPPPLQKKNLTQLDEGGVETIFLPV